jgi:hypothetical protein
VSTHGFQILVYIALSQMGTHFVDCGHTGDEYLKRFGWDIGGH